MGKIILEDIRDPRVDLLTVTCVEVSPDLRRAKAFVTVMGDEAHERTVMRGLDSAVKRIRGCLGSRTELRRVPELSFHLDEGMKQSAKMSNILAELASERGVEEQAPLDGACASDEIRQETEDDVR